MRLTLALCLTAALSGHPLMAQGTPPQEHLDALITALMDNGCELTDANAQTVLEASGLNGEDANVALRYLRSTNGLPRLSESADTNADGTATVTMTSCARAPATSGDLSAPRAALIAMLAAHDCSMLLEEAQPLLSEYGLDMMAVIAVVGAMEDAGEATVEGPRLTITPEVCAAAGQ